MTAAAEPDASNGRHPLSLAVNGRERLLERLLVPFPVAQAHGSRGRSGPRSVAVVGLGYVGLPTALALHGRVPIVTGVDIDRERLRAIEGGDVDLCDGDRRRLAAATGDQGFRLTTAVAAVADHDAVIVCVPTPVDERRDPDLTALRAACDDVVAHARSGQTIILTSTSFVGTTRELLIEPFRRRGMTVGTDVHVAFSPERIDPGNPDHVQRETPRVVGGATPECASQAAQVVRQLTDSVFLVTSPEAAELTKLYENIFRAVSLALANEVADICGFLGLDPIEVTLAAGTKPYGFLGALPGPGVGGHCIPCDPHYLLWQLRRVGRTAPMIEQAMRGIDDRPDRVVRRAAEVLAEDGLAVAGAKVIVVGAGYKAGVRDLRESPALPILAGLAARGADIHYHDPLLPVITLPGGRVLVGERDPAAVDWDLVLIHVVHPGVDIGWAATCRRVLDATYLFDAAAHRRVV
ncbi:nucleotide sugar dehydrogenase [Pseudonocardia hispaniensis]|uniref:Nucleotide sugar dehydrogenase n=1 Tax=Pseudonocardia hispaniensis TaxID=904933 RepID=A0ABW1J2B4_9PSEU